MKLLNKLTKYVCYTSDSFSYCRNTTLYKIIENKDYKLLRYILSKKPKLFTTNFMAIKVLFLICIKDIKIMKKLIKYNINLDQYYIKYCGNNIYKLYHIINFIINFDLIMDHRLEKVNNRYKLLKLLYKNRKKISINEYYFKSMPNKYKLITFYNLNNNINYYDLNLNKYIYLFF